MKYLISFSTSRYLLDKAKAVRSRPVWEPGPSRYDSFERPTPTPNYSNGNLYEQPSSREPEDSMLSSKTRSLLDKVKESTAALNDMSTNEVMERPSQRKSSRFLKRNSFDHSAEPRSYNTSVGRMDDGVGRMADEILGENIYPPREDSRTSAMRSSLPIRKHSYQSSSDADRFSDRSSPESRPTRYILHTMGLQKS